MIALDHALILVRALDVAAPAWQRLGFTLTPRGRHTELGTANHTVMFPRDYLELMTVAEPTETNARWRAALATGEGLHTLALATNDVVAAHARLASRGVSVQPPIRFGRTVMTANGAQEARFSVSMLEPDATPAFGSFLCQHHTRDLVWRPECQLHANTAIGLAGVTVIRDDPDRDGPAYERLLGTARVHPRPGGVTLALGGTQVWLVRPEYAAARLGRRAPGPGPLGLTVAVADLDAARRLLAAHGVPFRRFARRSILVEPTFASGVLLELLAA